VLQCKAFASRGDESFYQYGNVVVSIQEVMEKFRNVKRIHSLRISSDFHYIRSGIVKGGFAAQLSGERKLFEAFRCQVEVCDEDDEYYYEMFALPRRICH